MHNNYYFLRQLSASLEKVVIGAVVSECFSQNKDELIIRFEITNDSFYIKCTTSPAISCLTFHDGFNRARKNSIDLFNPVIGQKIESIRQFKNERSFAISMTGGFGLLFKMHGNMANIILLENDKAIDLFRSGLAADWEVSLKMLDREIDWSYEAFEKNENTLPNLYFTFGKRVWEFLASQGLKSMPVRQKYELIQHVRSLLEKPQFYLTYIGSLPVLSLVKAGSIKKIWSDPIQASNDFFLEFTRIASMTEEKNSAMAVLRSKIQSGENYIKKNEKKLLELRQNNDYKVWADLIMANLHMAKPNSTEITVQNFYNENSPIVIRLKRELTAQKNAETYYRKSKNQRIEIEKLEQGIKAKQAEVLTAQKKIKEIETSEDLKAIRKINTDLTDAAIKQKLPSLPYHEFEFNGFRIWVGKNAESNDALTLKFSFKEDLWLHAKDVAGSHVLIKYQAGKKFPKDVIERAAELAAYNSKRKNETLCPVIVTPKKFVRKRKGDPAGAVIVEREDVIMVEPRLQQK